MDLDRWITSQLESILEPWSTRRLQRRSKLRLCQQWVSREVGWWRLCQWNVLCLSIFLLSLTSKRLITYKYRVQIGKEIIFALCSCSATVNVLLWFDCKYVPVVLLLKIVWFILWKFLHRNRNQSNMFPLHILNKAKKANKVQRVDRRTNALRTNRPGPTDQPMDTASYKGALSHLKNKLGEVLEHWRQRNTRLRSFFMQIDPFSPLLLRRSPGRSNMLKGLVLGPEKRSCNEIYILT